jgi:hypothetical protein
MFKLSSDDLPRRAVSLVKNERRHQKFGDFDDHLEEVSIGRFMNRVIDCQTSLTRYNRLASKWRLFSYDFVVHSFSHPVHTSSCVQCMGLTIDIESGQANQGHVRLVCGRNLTRPVP